MTCFHPIPAWQIKKTNAAGKRPITFSMPSDSWNFDFIHVPCGQCVGCRLDYSRQWAARCMCEYMSYKERGLPACFITLTYQDADLPRSNETGFPTLCKRDFVLFMKRLRKEVKQKIRFFACGEYGSTTERPHYHAIIYGYDFGDDRYVFGWNFRRDLFYRSPLLERLWPSGNSLIGSVSYDSCCYVARYLLKKQKGAGAAVYTEKDIVPEFVTMSRRGGIGYG